MQNNKTLNEQLADIDKKHDFVIVLKELVQVLDDKEAPMDLRFKCMDLLQKAYMQGYNHAREVTTCIYQVAEYGKLKPQNQ